MYLIKDAKYKWRINGKWKHKRMQNKHFCFKYECQLDWFCVPFWKFWIWSKIKFVWFLIWKFAKLKCLAKQLKFMKSAFWFSKSKFMLWNYNFFILQNISMSKFDFSIAWSFVFRKLFKDSKASILACKCQ